MNSTIWVYLAVCTDEFMYVRNVTLHESMYAKAAHIGDAVADDGLVDGVDEILQREHLVREDLRLRGHALQSVQRVLAHLAHLMGHRTWIVRTAISFEYVGNELPLLRQSPRCLSPTRA